MGMSVGGSGKVKSEPNVVPMIDVMLVLLIIFMLIIPQLTAGFDSNPPKALNLIDEEEEETDQVLGIDKKGRYYYNKQPIANEALADTIARVYRDRGDTKLFIRADKDLAYGLVLNAIDIVSKNGVLVAAMISEEAGDASNVSSAGAAQTGPGGGL
jgi:biopolymer transport protein ExbD